MEEELFSDQEEFAMEKRGANNSRKDAKITKRKTVLYSVEEIRDKK